MNLAFDLAHLDNLPRQRSFLHAVAPVLAALEPIDAILLAGSLARQDADSWSSVDICLIWKKKEEGATISGRRRHLKDALDRALGKRGYQLGPTSRKDGDDSLLGFTLADGPPGGTNGQRVASGVLFRFFWDAIGFESELRSRSGPVRPIYLSPQLSPELGASLNRRTKTPGPPDPDVIGAQLGQFWLLLAQLPAVLERRENLAAHALLAETRSLLLDLVVALNGTIRPQSNTRINQYLGPKQRDSFEKSLGKDQTHSGPVSHRASWIGQAVALVVLYRWYAPQLSEIFCAPYPQQAEDTVLALLRDRIDGWPAVIDTD